MRSFTLLLAAIWLTFAGVPSPVNADGRARYISYEDAAAILEALQEALPPELRAVPKSELSSVWRGWVQRRDQEIRTRLVQGDEDSIVNFLLFGTSFTRRPRITLSSLAQFGDRLAKSANTSPEVASFLDSIKARADDLIQAMASPRANERLLFAQSVLEGKVLDPRAEAGRARVKEYLLTSLIRVLNEQSGYAKILQAAQLLGDPSAEFAERSKLFSNRGLSSDTSLLPNFAIERALSSMKARGMLVAGSVRRVAIVGPGLDFTDKQDGYDFYPQQTIQPFAIVDTLFRLGLARSPTLKVTTLDLSPRINDHIRRARARAQSGVGYVVQLPRDAQGQWKPEALSYWTRFGDQIGAPVVPVSVPAGAGDVKVRAVRIRPSIVSALTPEDLNIVVQRLELPAAESFDLIIATNILVYYDVFEQSLALKNIERMLRPGGFLLSNNALLELPSSLMHSVGYETVVYSDKPNDGDHIVWYQRSADK
ncbi:MAG TPA: class I SAM-dependent methyltransferase [Blastocatellia bacterium]|nr:class I SAM-dependent methyltransferase [Blastocatellia bacterium]